MTAVDGDELVRALRARGAPIPPELAERDLATRPRSERRASGHQDAPPAASPGWIDAYDGSAFARAWRALGIAAYVVVVVAARGLRRLARK